MTTPEQSTPHSLVVIGGGAAARNAALAFREAGGTGSVVVLTDETAPPYRRPPLSKGYLRGEVPLSDMSQHSDDGEYDEKGITVLLGAGVRSLDTGARTVTTTDGGTHAYETCILATGAEAALLPVPGADDPRVRTLRTLDDATALREAASSAQHVVVIGSGFVGCEAAVSLVSMGKTVTMVSDEELPQVTRLGADVGRTVAGWLTEAGVTLIGGAKVTGLRDGTTVLLDGHDPVAADLVLTAVGSRPLGGLAVPAGLSTHGGRIVVDEHMATSAPGVFAAGDVAYARNTTAGRHLAVEHWNDAVAMGTIAGTAAAGGDATWDSVPGFFSDIGKHHLQYSAWGDGWDSARFVDHGEGSFTVWYGQDGTTVGVLTCGADDDAEKGEELVRTGAPLPD